MSRCGRRKDIPLHLTRGTQPGLHSVQIRIVVPRMANELPRTFWEAAHYSRKQFLVEVSGRNDSKRSIGSLHSGVCDRLPESFFETPKYPHLRIPLPQLRTSHQMGKCERPHWSEWVAQCFDPACFCRANQRLIHRRQDVCVLVRVEVRNLHAGSLKLVELRFGLTLDLIGVDLAL